MIGVGVLAAAVAVAEATVGPAQVGGVPEAETLAALVRSREVLATATKDVGFSLNAARIRTRVDGSKLHFSVESDGREGALAQCTAILRALEAQYTPVDPSIPFLRETWETTWSERETLAAQLTPTGGAGAVRQKALETLAALADNKNPDAAVPPRLRSLLLEQQTDQKTIELQTRMGLGPQHPEVVANRDRRLRRDVEIAEQRKLEERAQKALIAELERKKLDEVGLVRAQARAGIAALREASSERCLVASGAPRSVEEAIARCASARERLDRLRARVGERHPDFIAVQHELGVARDLLKDAITQATRELDVQAQLPALPNASEISRELAAKSVMLAGIGNAIVRATTTRESNVRVVTPCH